MKALVLNSVEDFTYEERLTPECLGNGLLVKIQAVCICGSDAGAILGKNALFSYPRVLGHEVAGIVTKVGSTVEGFTVGDKVSLLPCISCGKCRACQKGHTNACSVLKLYGVQVDGGLCQYMTAPASNWLKLPTTIDFASAAMLEPLAVGAHAISKVSIQEGDKVLIIGAGPIGASVAENARVRKAQVFLADLSPKRRAYVEKEFTYKVFNPSDKDYLEQLKAVTDDQLFDVVVDTTAAKPSMENCWRYIANSGKIIFVGICSSTIELDGKGFHSKEPSLFVTRNSTRKDFEEVLSRIESGEFIPHKYITHHVDFNHAKDEIIRWVNPDYGVFKGVVDFS